MPHQRDLGRRVVLVTSAAALVGAAAWAEPRIVRAGDPLPLRRTAASGATITASEPSRLTATTDAPMHVRQAVPGTGDAMRVTVRNHVTAPTTAVLRVARLAERAGIGGGRLSQRLVVTVSTAEGRVAYRGTIAGLGRVTLGTLPARGELALTLRVDFPDGGVPPGPTTGDNAFQGASVDVGYAVEPR